MQCCMCVRMRVIRLIQSTNRVAVRSGSPGHNIRTYIYTYVYIHIYIKTHGSESWGQEEAGLRDEPVSYLQVAPL